MKKLLLIFWVLCLGVLANASEYWYENASFYQIFPRSFLDTDGDGVGDLEGIIKKLDYVSSLGVKGIWLNPTFPSPSYHGYDITDYYGVDVQLGNIETMKKLIREADKRGIKILLDLVINHTSTQIEWFRKSELRDPFFSDWYIWTEIIPKTEGKIGWAKPWLQGNSPWEVWHFSRIRNEYYYGAFWSGMPDLNLRNKNVTEEIYRISKYWLEMGVGGFRLDAIRYLIESGPGPQGQADTKETKEWLKNFTDYVKSIKRDAFLIGEVWTGNNIVSTYYGSVDGCFDFEAREVIASTVGYGPRVGKFYQYLSNMISLTRNDVKRWKFFFPFSSNHDVTRIASILAYRNNNLERLKLGMIILFTLPGNPFIYYGDEIGMTNSFQRGDLAFRNPMQWNNKKNSGFSDKDMPWYQPNVDQEINVEYQEKRSNSLLNTIRWVSKLRNSEVVLQKGILEIVSNNIMNRLVSFARILSNDYVLVLVYPYPDGTNTTIFFPFQVSEFYDIVSNEKFSVVSNKLEIELKPFSFLILRKH